MNEIFFGKKETSVTTEKYKTATIAHRYLEILRHQMFFWAIVQCAFV